nr:hypothetical protein [uncultured Acetatifactor sp.]
MDIGTVLELLSDRETPDLEEGLFNPMVTNLEGVYVAESFEKYLF